MAIRSRWKIIGLAVGAIVATVVAALAAAPYVIDVAAYKPALIEAVRQATGRELVIDGRMRLRIFPVPGIGAGQVHFSNALGTKGAQMVDVRWVSVKPSVLALLQGRFEIESLTLYRPTIVLETDAEGRPNWEFQPGAGASQAPGAASSGMHLAVGRFSIVRGIVHYTNPHTQKTMVAENVDASAWVESFAGPFRIAGSATVNGVNLVVDVKVGAPTGAGNDATLALQFSSGTLDFTGKVSRIAPDADIEGKLSVATGLLTDFVADAIVATGGDQPTMHGAAVGRFAFDGAIEVTPERVAIRDFTLTMGPDSATGSLALTQKPVPLIEGRVALSSLELERWQEALANPEFATLLTRPAPPPERPSPAAASKPPPAATSKPPPAAPSKPPVKPVAAAAAPAPSTVFPPEVNAKVTVDVERVTWRRGTIRDLSLSLEITKGVLAVPRFKAILPGEMTLDAAAGATDGTFNLSGERLRETLQWLEVDVGAVPDGRLRTLDIKGRLKTAAGSLQLSDATIILDGQSAKASATMAFGPPLVWTMQVQMDRLELDGYLPGLPGFPSTVTASTASAAAAPSTGLPPQPSFGLKAKVAKLVWRGQTLGGIDSDVTLQGNVLKLNDMKVADLLGGKASLSGQVRDFGTTPQVDLTFSVSVPDADRLAAYLQMPKLVGGKMGAASASGRVTGSARSLSLSNLAVSALGASGRASGKLALTDAVDFDFPSFSLQAPDLGRLLSAASGRPASGLGAVSAAGSLKGSSRRAAFNGEFQALGVKMKGTLDATLGARPRIAAALQVPGTLDLDRWMGMSTGAAPAGQAGGTVAPPRSGAVSARPIDLAALRSFDASLSLRTTAIEVASIKVDYADLDATLANGVLGISRLTGQFYGGAVDFAGTVNAAGRALAVDLSGSVNGIYLGELLRGTMGDSEFGNDHLTVALDGKVNANNIHLHGNGSTSQEIRNGLTGGAALSGYVYPVVVKGSRSFAHFATSVGGIFSSEMAFNSLMLRSFVDRQSPLTGQVQLTGAHVMVDQQTVQGQNATANITSRTNLDAGTTDTTVKVTGGGDQFVVTLQGALAAPKMSTARVAR